MARTVAIWPCLATIALGGCSTGGGSAVEGPVTLYVSLPLSGPLAEDGHDAADGARLALEQAGGRAGGLEVRARYLDDARGSAWDPVAVGRNARRAVQDSSTAAYIGELDSEPTRASVPITNDAGIVQISPGAGGTDLTRPTGGYPDSPGRYRPSGSATFARVIPDDAELVRASAQWAGEMGLSRVLGASDGSAFGQLMLSEFSTDAAEVGVQVKQEQAERVISATDPSFLGGGGQGPGVLSAGGVSYLTSGALDPGRLPKGNFTNDFIGRFAREPGPYAAYGFEAMRVALEAIGAAQDKDDFRSAVVDGVLDSEHPDSILGLYSITAEGDTTLCAIQRYEVPGGGEPVPLQAVCPRR